MAVPHKQIVLVGMPGSGKSSVGRLLGQRLGLIFRDTDKLIERRAGCSITALFEQQGEPHFRRLEAELIRDLVECDESSVIATGGGAVSDPDSRALMTTRCHTFYLRATPELLFSRTRRDTKRPLLQVDDPLGRLRELLRKREPLYQEAAAFTMDMHDRSITGVVNRIAMQIEMAALTAIADESSLAPAAAAPVRCDLA